MFESESDRKCENKYNIGDIRPYPIYLHLGLAEPVQEMMKKKRKMTGRRISPILLYKDLSDLAPGNVLIIMERE